MSWTLADIRTEVRNLTGRKNSANPSNTDLNERINRFIKFKLIQYAKFLKKQDYYSFNTASGESGTYSLPTDFQVLEADGFVDDETLRIYRDPDQFWRKWNIDSSNEAGKPYEALLWANAIYLRPTPDAAYTVRIKGWEKFSELTSDGDSLSAEGNEGWGEVVAYGTAVDILNSDGNFERAEIVRRGFKRTLNAAMDDTTTSLTDQRASPKW